MNLEEHALRVAVLSVRAARLGDELKAARADAQEAYRIARQAGISQLRPRLPGGAEAGRISIEKGPTVITWDDEALLRVVEESTPEHAEDYVSPAALRDKRALDLLREHLPDLTGRRVTAERKAELEEVVTATRGLLLSLATGDKVRVAAVETLEATGTFSYVPGKPGIAAVLAALSAGEVTPDGYAAVPQGEAGA